MTNEFELKILGTGWGFTGTIDELCGRIKKEGYDGIEVLWPAEKKAQEELFAALEKYELELGLLCAGFDSDYQKHLEEFIAATNEAATQTIRRPLFINCHSGRDHFSYEQNKAFIDHTNPVIQGNRHHNLPRNAPGKDTVLGARRQALPGYHPGAAHHLRRVALVQCERKPVGRSAGNA